PKSDTSSDVAAWQKGHLSKLSAIGQLDPTHAGEGAFNVNARHLLAPGVVQIGVVERSGAFVGRGGDFLDCRIGWARPDQWRGEVRLIDWGRADRAEHQPSLFDDAVGDFDRGGDAENRKVERATAAEFFVS